MSRGALIYLTGEPGAGKSTLMRKLTADYSRLPVIGSVARDLLIHAETGEVVGEELGKRRVSFSGTDALGMAVIGAAVEYLTRAQVPVILAEGARLSNARFLAAAVDAGWEVTLGLLDHPDAAEWRAARAGRIGHAQSPAWVSGRRTAALRLAADPPEGVTVVRGNPQTVYDALKGWDRRWLPH